VLQKNFKDKVDW